MSFAAPAILLTLLALPLLLAYYLMEQRRRRSAAAAFAAPALQPSIAPRHPGWRRHAPMLAIALALAVLVIAAAKPQRTVAVPVERASVMLATDVSGSMTATDVQPSRLVAVKRAARRFVDEVPARVNVGVLAFNSSPRVLQSPTRDREVVKTAIESMQPSGGTATGEAIAAATEGLRRESTPGERRPPAAILLLSDGKSTSGRDAVTAARAAARMEVPVYTVVLGTDQGTITVPRAGGGTATRPVPPDPESLREIARVSEGKAYTAHTAAGLKEIYESLGSQLGHENKKRQITSAVTGGGLLLMLAGVAMSLRWFGRLI
jgi:Ca-activated chloride channel family protein